MNIMLLIISKYAIYEINEDIIQGLAEILDPEF
jgi:hypothetical protein